jgi:hypothetical protein
MAETRGVLDTTGSRRCSRIPMATPNEAPRHQDVDCAQTVWRPCGDHVEAMWRWIGGLPCVLSGLASPSATSAYVAAAVSSPSLPVCTSRCCAPPKRSRSTPMTATCPSPAGARLDLNQTTPSVGHIAAGRSTEVICAGRKANGGWWGSSVGSAVAAVCCCRCAWLTLNLIVNSAARPESQIPDLRCQA